MHHHHARFVSRLCAGLGVLTLTLGVGMAQAQEPPASCEQELRQVRMELNMGDINLRTTRRQMAIELRQTIDRAEKAEQALAAAQEELKKRAAKPEKQE